MAIQTVKAGARRYRITADVNGQLLELGPAGTTTLVSTMVVQFTPDAFWNGEFVVMGRTLGVAADEVDVPFVPIPYRRVSLADVASDYAIAIDPVSGAALINVPANGMSIALLVACAAGSGYITAWDLQGNSAV